MKNKLFFQKIKKKKKKKKRKKSMLFD